MMDIYPKNKRSQIMSNIRSKMTGLEIKGWSVLKKTGMNFRKNPKGIFGNPDAANKRRKIAVFFDSAFWHGYDWKNRKHSIKSNRTFWLRKIEGNILRDRRVNRTLREQGWIVIRLWEHQIIEKNLAATLKRIERYLRM